jgi:transposase-like protein
MAKKRTEKSTEVIISEPVNKGGRPSLYKPEYCERVIEFGLLGLKEDEMAQHFGVSHDTLRYWREQYPEFAEALRQGKLPADASVARSLFQRANGYSWVDQQAIKVKDIEYDANGKKIRETERVEIVEVTRRAPPDTTAGIFWLKNRRYADWRDRKELEVGRVGEFDNKSTEELVDYIIGEATELGLSLPEVKAPNSKGSGAKH